MAIMYPSVIPDYILSDPYREAEVYVYEQLRRQLPDGYRCYYSRPWLGITSTGEEKEGEADFVIAHPDRGLMTIEVKGGRISRIEDTEQWQSRNRMGITNNIKDPVLQASKSKHELLRKLREDTAWSRRWITIRHGVIFPDCMRASRVLGASMPHHIFAFGSDMDDLLSWVEGRFTRQGGDDTAGEGLGPDGMRALHRLIAGPIELRQSLQRGFRTDRREIERLTREQFDVLNALEDQPQMAISGGAGTGKTLLALEKASRLAEEGKRVLLTCFNQALGEYLKALTAHNDDIEAGGFHSICGTLIRRSGTEPPSGPASELYSEQLPQALIKAIGARPDLAFDAVIVDEGQDFEDGWLTALRLCLREPDKDHFYVFYDDNQQVYARSGGWLADLPQSRFHLTRNLRNTRSIHASSRGWYSSQRLCKPVGPQGEPVVWRATKKDEAVTPLVCATISDLVGRHGIKRGDIAVLTAGQVENNALSVGGELCGAPFARAGDLADNRLIFDTVRRFKGLDRPVVLLVDIEKLTSPELTYVALTRPSVLLYVFGAEGDLATLKSGRNSVRSD